MREVKVVDLTLLLLFLINFIYSEHYDYTADFEKNSYQLNLSQCSRLLIQAFIYILSYNERRLRYRKDGYTNVKKY